MTHSLTILDLGNVLVDFQFDKFINRCAEVSTRSREEIRSRIFGSEHLPQIERGEISDETMFAWMVDWLSWPPERKNDLIYFWCDIFSETKGARDAVQMFKARGPVWILSDTVHSHIKFIREHFPYALDANRVLTSYERGMCKSDEGAFDLIVKEAGVPAEQILFFDDIQVNIDAAKKVGIDARLFTGWENAFSSPSGD